MVRIKRVSYMAALLMVSSLLAIVSIAAVSCKAFPSPYVFEVYASDGVFEVTKDGVLRAKKELFGDVVIPSQISDVKIKKIGYEAFLNYTGIASVTVSDSVTEIGGRAFYGCTSLASVTIPSSVTTIDRYAFSNCTSLVDINYAGTKAQWGQVYKGDYWKPNAAVVHCTDGDV